MRCNTSMRRATQILHHLSIALTLAIGMAAHGSPPPIDDEFIEPHGARPHRIPHPQRRGLGLPFHFLTEPLGGVTAPPTEARPSWLAGGTIAALPTGALALDPDSGELALLDDELKPVARVAIGLDATQLVHRDGRAYVVDRAGDRVVVVVVSIEKQKLTKQKSFAVRAEPFGVALTPDGATLLVTSILDESLTGYDASSGKERWRVVVGAEPRGVALSPDGKHAIVTSLTTGAIARIDLAASPPKVDFVAISPMPPARNPALPEIGRDAGRGFARNAYAALFIGNGLGIVAHQVSRPNLTSGFQEARTTYGGGFDPPVEHQLTFVSGRALAEASILAHQPRALAWDPKTDTLYIAGYGTDQIVAIGDASQRGARHLWSTSITNDGDSCGPSGISIASDGTVLVSCELTRRVARVEAENQLTLSTPLFESRYTEEERRGRAMFRQGANPALSGFGATACTSCHAEGRADGLSWRIEGHQLQTPILAGRLAGTHPFKWDGKDATLKDSLRNTIARLGGSGIAAADLADLEAWVLKMPRPRAPKGDPKAVARGKKLFQSEKTGCATCHGGASLSDGKRHDLAIDLDEVDTPSLIGLAVSAPYYHDGSATTLRAALMERGTVHGMGSTSSLSSHDLDDLIAYLETL